MPTNEYQDNVIIDAIFALRKLASTLPPTQKTKIENMITYITKLI